MFKALSFILQNHDEQIEAIFEAIRQLMAPTESTQRRIGFPLKEYSERYTIGKRSYQNYKILKMSKLKT